MHRPDVPPAAASAACAVCGTRGAGHVCSKDGYPFYRCDRCRFLFMDPMPGAAELEAFYNDGYREASSGRYSKAASRSRRAFFKALRFLPWIAGKRVLDVGCGGGFMVKAFSRFAAEACGLDISQGSIDYARRHCPKGRFYCEDFETFARRGLEFEFVFTTDLMEHMPGTESFMSLVAKVTRPGSRVYVRTPDAGHPSVPARLEDWEYLTPPEHVQFFDQQNLTWLFEGYGFKLVRVWPMKSYTLSLMFTRASGRSPTG